MPPEPEAAPAAELRSQAARFGLELVTDLADDMLDPDLVAGLPVEWARARAMLPIRHRGRPAVLTARPDDLESQKHLELLAGRELLPVLADRALIAAAIERCYFSRKDTARDFLRDLGPAAADAGAPARSDDLLAAANAPVTQLVNLVLLEAVKAGASDVHVEPFSDRLRVRYRIDGLLYEQAAPPKHLEPALVSRLKVMARLDISEKRLPQDGAARVRIGEREIDIRVSTIPVAEGERVVLRLLNRGAALLPLSGLGLSDRMLGELQALVRAPRGLVLVCGPTGSGKTTTLYAALQELDKQRTNILTIEDPIEYQLPEIGQMQVKPKIGLTFASGLRHILRQDPDTILVGEIRDLETAEIAIRASLTGHLVFSTLHTNDAAGAVVRLVDMGVEPYLVAAALRAVLAQRLVRRLCPACRRPASAPEEVAGLPPSARARLAAGPLWQARGCAACLDGYRSRIGLFEFLPVDAELAALIRAAGGDSRRLGELARRRGLATLLDDGLDKIEAGLTSLPEVLRAWGSPD